MNTDYRKAAKKLRDAVSDNSHMSAAELRTKLTEEGVDVGQFLTRVDVAFRRGLQEGVRQQSAQAKARAAVLKGTLFGSLVGKTREALVALYEAATAGNYGSEAMARCRNKNAEALTDDELRSWLEDIERLNAGK
jgi:hypothetical protein